MDSSCGDTFMLADSRRVSARRLQLADVVVHPAEPTETGAAARAERTLRKLTGCVLVAVGIAGGGSVILWRGARSAVRTPHDATTAAVHGYAMLLRNRSASSPARGSPLCS
jgi:hypothetical protein